MDIKRKSPRLCEVRCDGLRVAVVAKPADGMCDPLSVSDMVSPAILPCLGMQHTCAYVATEHDIRTTLNLAAAATEAVLKRRYDVRMFEPREMATNKSANLVT
jgi:hypothetical protein